jgi:DNA replication and repair protein RecF
MQITRLNIERVRNLKTVALHELQPFNIFTAQMVLEKLQF